MKKVFDIASNLVRGELYLVADGIFVLEIPDKYDRAMFFCKYQEFYESPMEHIRGKYFTLEEFMRAYKNYKEDDTFTYPSDWEGFNIPSNILVKAVDKFQNDSDNDRMMEQVYMVCSSLYENFYLIGVDNIKSATYKHEMAHALFYLNKKYKSSVRKLMKEIDEDVYKMLVRKVMKMGYPIEVAEDEIQAYLCHGWRVPCHTERFRKNLEKFLTK